MKQGKVDHYGATYGRFAAKVYADVRARAFGVDIGQTGWITDDEQDMFVSWLQLDAASRLLDVACGSGGPLLRIARLTGCHGNGIDIHEDAVRTAAAQARAAGLSDRVTFQQLDASKPLPFADGSFDAVTCIDAINHLPDRSQVLREWARILKPGGRVVFTDPIVVCGPLSNDEMTIRSSVGFYLFVPAGYDEEVLAETGFEVVEKADRTENMARMAKSWWQARQDRADDLRQIEGTETFEGQQRLFEVSARLAKSRRLCRFAFMARRKSGEAFQQAAPRAAH